MTRVFLLAAVLLAPALAVAQDPPIRWGQITDEEIALHSFPDDPDAGAVVLGDVGFSELFYDSGAGFQYRLRRHRRVKVLRESGYGEGEFALRFDKEERVLRVKGQTFVPEPDGSMRRVALERGSIFQGDVSAETREVRFTLPALTPGAIFEVEYTYETGSILSPPPWYFQSDVPTLVSEYRFEVPPYFAYVVLKQGERLESHEARTHNRRDWRSQELRWSARDLPALRDEPYTTTEADYAYKVGLQLKQAFGIAGMYGEMLSTWPQVAETLDGHDMFGRRLRRNRRVSEIAGSVSGTGGERARALYDHVREGYVWNERGGVFAERDLDAVVAGRGGSAGELNLLLLALLREAGVPATPVLLSTRSNGKPLQEYPIVRQFDHLLILVELEGAAPVLLDATDRHRPYGLLPVEALNGAGWLADPERPVWIAFDPVDATGTTVFVRGALGPDGGLAGTTELRLTGYDALGARTRLADAAAGGAGDAAAQTAAYAADAPEELGLTTVSVDGADDPYVPLDLSAVFSTTAGETVADEIYLTPFVVMRLDENPFERPTREFPVDFAYPFTRTYVAEIELPDGYVVEDLPAVVQMTIPSGAVTYTRVAGVLDGKLVVRAVLRVSQARVLPEEYPSLRALYDEIVATESEAIVVARAAAGAVEPSSIESESAASPDDSDQ